jgi:hypothetical protein
MGAGLYPFGDRLAPVISKTYSVAVDPHIDALSLQILADPCYKFGTGTIVAIAEKDTNGLILGFLDSVWRWCLKPAFAIGAKIAATLAAECAWRSAGWTKSYGHGEAPFK